MSTMAKEVADTPAAAERRKQRAEGGSSRGPKRSVELMMGVAGLVTLIGLWAIASATGFFSPRAVPSPADVGASFIDLLVNPKLGFWLALVQTLSVALIGIILVIVIAIPFAMAIHNSRFFRDSTWFMVEFLKPIPPIALIPLTILVWGQSKTVELILVIFGSIWPMLTQLVYGLREVSGVALDMAKVYRFTPAQRAFRVTIPSLTPFAMTGLRISVNIALIVAVVTEFIVAIPGLGQMLAVAQNNSVLDRAYALIVVLGLLGIGLNGLVNLLNRPLLFWHASQRERTAQ